MSKKINQTILLIVGMFVYVAIAFAADKVIDSFKANANENNVTIEWTTNSETGVSRFEVQRANISNPVFKTITMIKAKGIASTYSYKDSDSFMKGNTQNEIQAKNSVTYRIKVTYDNQKEEYSDEIIAKPMFGSVKRTWGMIKEMFK